MKDQMKINPAKTIHRKTFFGKFGKSFLGLILVSSFPFKLFSKSSSSKNKIKINPHAVKRNKDGFK